MGVKQTTPSRKMEWSYREIGTPLTRTSLKIKLNDIYAGVMQSPGNPIDQNAPDIQITNQLPFKRKMR
jgi:hypothetical protein